MNADTHPSSIPPSWTGGYERVVTGPPPEGGLFTLAAMGGDRFGDLVDLLRPHCDDDPRKSAITVAHYALAVVVRLVVEPLLVDGLLVAATPDQLGFTTDTQLESFAYWAGDVAVSSSRDVEGVGAVIGSLLDPVLRRVREAGRVAPAGVELVVLDSLLNQARRLVRRADAGLPSDTAERLAEAAGLRSPLAERWMVLTVDGGAPVELAVPRVCCVLSSCTSDHACPTCPSYDDETRRRVATNWVAEMDDDEFEETFGRARVHPR